MNPMDEVKTAFIGDTSKFFYRVMPFGLKNAGATYKRQMDRFFKDHIGRNIEVYIDDMVAKTKIRNDHVEDLNQIFQQLRKHNMCLNPAKCTFSIRSGKLLGFVLLGRGIEENPDNCRAIIEMRSPESVKEVQQLTGRIAVLSRFMSKVGEKARSFFQCIKKTKAFQWTDECEGAFQRIKTFLSSQPVVAQPHTGDQLMLYLSALDFAVSATLVREEKADQQTFYFVSKVLQGTEVQYQLIKKVVLALIVAARKLRQYFQSHTIVVRTNVPIQAILQKPDLAGRMEGWTVEFSEFDIHYENRKAIKAQALSDFLLERTSISSLVPEAACSLWVDGANNVNGAGAGIILEGPEGLTVE
jgi:hypothetical protein